MKQSKNKLLSIVLRTTMVVLVFVLSLPVSAAHTGTKNQGGLLEKKQIDYEYKEGKITIDEYMLYKAWAVFNPSKLSGTKYALSPEEAQAHRKCGAMIVLEVKENWYKLNTERNVSMKMRHLHQ